jgi:hypothetical protein
MTNTVTFTMTQEEAELIHGYLQDIAYDGETSLYDGDCQPLKAIVDAMTDIVYPLSENA